VRRSRGFAVALGIVVGALAAVVGSRVRDLDPNAQSREADIEGRIRRLEQVGRPEGRPASPEVQGREHRSLHAAAIAKHVREPVDAEWAASMSRLLSRDLEVAAAEGRYKLARVDCRTTSCIAAFEWPSRQEAMKTHGGLVRALPDVPCSREILLEEEAAPSERFVATMVFQCERGQPGPGR
jgi:hypothetical protein